MGFYKKTIMLTNKENYEKGIGVLNLEKTSAGIFATIRIYDLASDNLVLGMSSKGDLIKQHIMPEKNGYTFKIKENFDIDSDVGCVLCRYVNDKFYPLLWGSGVGNAKLKDDIITLFNNANEVKKNNENDGLHSTMQNEEKPVNVAEKIDLISQPKSDETDSEKAKLFEADEDEVEELIDNEVNEEASFFDLISGQVDEIFNNFPEDKMLSDIIPNSRWVRVDYDNAGKEYIFGLIYEHDKIKYVAYGVPGEFDTIPPDSVAGYSQWLPIGDGGFWIMFQDAETGENISIDNLTIF